MCKEPIPLEKIMEQLTPQRRAAVLLRARALLDEQNDTTYGEELRKSPAGCGDFS